MIHINFLHREDLDDETREIFERDIRDEWRKADIDSERCPCCCHLLEDTYETDDAYGTPIRVLVEYCPSCGWERREL